MTRTLRIISIHASMITVLACFVVAITLVAAMGVISERHASEALVDLNRVSAEKTSEVARADALLNRSRNDIALAEHYVLRGEMSRADGYLGSAVDGLERAEARFRNVASSTKTEEAEVLANSLETDFQAVVQLVRQQHSALVQRDSDTFDQLIGELRAPAASLEEQASRLEQAVAVFRLTGMVNSQPSAEAPRASLDAVAWRRTTSFSTPVRPPQGGDRGRVGRILTSCSSMMTNIPG